MELVKGNGTGKDVYTTLAEIEKDYVLKTYEKFGYNKEKTAKALGVGRATLYRKLESYGVTLKKRASK